MSMQWTLIAFLIYLEIFIILILVSPIFNFRRWNTLLQRPLILCIREYAYIYFYSLMGILVLLLIDSFRELVKYAHSPDITQIQMTTETKNSIKLFKSQRNFYVLGSTIFLTILLKRVIAILIVHHDLQETFDNMIGRTQEVLKMTAEAATEDAEERLQQKIDDMEENLQESLRSLEEQKLKCNEIEKEAKKWKQKYEELKRIVDVQEEK